MSWSWEAWIVLRKGSLITSGMAGGGIIKDASVPASDIWALCVEGSNLGFLRGESVVSGPSILDW